MLKNLQIEVESLKRSNIDKDRIISDLKREIGVDSVLKNLQTEVDNLKKSNSQKEKVIDDLKKEMDHKITHYMFFG